MNKLGLLVVIVLSSIFLYSCGSPLGQATIAADTATKLGFIQVDNVLEVNPSSVAPGNTVTLTANAQDQDFGIGSGDFFAAFKFTFINKVSFDEAKPNINNPVNAISNTHPGANKHYTYFFDDPQAKALKVSGKYTVPADTPPGPLEVGVWMYKFDPSKKPKPGWNLDTGFILPATITVLPKSITSTVTAEASCTGDKECLVGLYADSNSHATTCGGASKKLCVKINNNKCNIECSKSLCNSDKKSIKVVSLNQDENSHVNEQSSTDICCKIGNALECTEALGSCKIKSSCASRSGTTLGELALGQAYQASNSHIGSTGGTKSICCSMIPRPNPQLIDVTDLGSELRVAYNTNFKGGAVLKKCSAVNGGKCVGSITDTNPISNLPSKEGEPGMFTVKKIQDVSGGGPPWVLCHKTRDICSPPLE